MSTDKSVYIEGSFSGTIVTGDNSNVHEAPHVVPKILTKQVGLASDINFVGRKDELQKVDKLLNQNSTLLLINGIGGIGKSTLASYYLNQKKDEFNHYAFIQVGEDIKSSFASTLSTSLDLKSEKMDDLFNEALNKLQNLKGEKLLIIDDAKDIANQHKEIDTIMTLKNSGFKILFTSREVKENISQYFLDIMSIEDARELFLKYHSTNEIDKVDKILEYLDYHTLFIEMTAKTLTQRKRTLSLDKIIEKFVNGEFAVIKKNKNESFNKFLNDLFVDDKILKDKDTLLFLKRLSILPSIEISFEDLYRFLACKDEEKLEIFLIDLASNGWLIESDNKYKFHQILKEFVWDKYNPSIEDTKDILVFFDDFIGNTYDLKIVIEKQMYVIYYKTFYNFLKRLNIHNKYMISFFNKLAGFYMSTGIYNKAEQLLKETLKITESLFGKEHLDTLTIYNNLASLYKNMGYYENSEALYLEVLNISRQIFGSNSIEVAMYENNIGGLYELMGLYNKAIFFYEKGLMTREKLLGNYHRDTATSYNNLSVVYMLKNLYKKAESLANTAWTTRLVVLGELHYETAQSYNNLGLIYQSMKEYSQAEYFLKEGLRVRIITLGEKHYDTAISYDNLAELYREIKKYEEAEPLYFKALGILRNTFGEEHHDTIIVYGNLGIFYFDIKNYCKAYEYMKKVTSYYQKKLPNNHNTLINSKMWLKNIKEKLGDCNDR